MNLLALIELQAGGPGSGCNPAAGHCGRPISNKMLKIYRRVLKKTGVKTRGRTPEAIKKTYEAHRRGEAIRKAHSFIKQAIEKKARAHIAKAHLKKIGKTTPGLKKSGGRIHIDTKPVWKGNIKKQWVAQGGHKVTELKAPKAYEKSGKSWIGKPSQYKGQFLADAHGAFNQNTIGNPKERNSFWIHQAAPEKGVSLEVHRNLGDLRVKVIERTLGAYDAIIQHREVEFKNVGRAMGFLNRRYGITYKIK